MDIIVYYSIAILCIAILLTLAFTVMAKRSDKTKSIALKSVSGVLAFVLFFRYMSGNDEVRKIIQLAGSPISSKPLTAISLLLIWGMYACLFLLILYPFFKVEFSKRLIKFFAFPIAILNLIFLIFPIQGITGVQSLSFRGVLMAIEAGISVAYCIYIWVKDFSFKFTWKDFGWFALSVFGILVATMPSYIPQSFLGYANPRFEVDGFSQTHRIFLYFAFIIPVLIYFALRKRNKEVIRFALLYLSLATLLTFMSSFRFQHLANPVDWPLHLCHTAMYIVPICIIFKWEKLFYFTFFINVLGAFIALAIPNTTTNMFSSSLIHFWSNHYCAFFMPILCVALKIYDRPKLKQFIYSAVAFSIYFILIILINAWFTNYGTVDYFFLNSDFVVEKLGVWAEKLRDVTWTFYIGNLKFVLYPLYQFLFYLVYISAAAGMWFLYEQSYLAIDLWADMAKRKTKIKLDRLALENKMEGRNLKEPLNPKNTNKLILTNFTKRYGSSNVYAVKDANLEIKGGDIFGFLGPNGAGKSTIIKSIVGIQPITDGSIEVCGFDVEKQPVESKQKIGFVPDHYALYEKLTGREYINYIADLYEVNNEDRTARINKYVGLFELTGAFDNQMKTYSHGMKQKIAIMAALVHNPKVWILDEPLTGLDPNSIFQVKECMKLHAKEGNIVFFSSHIIDVVERICTKIAIIKKGQIQCVKTMKELEKSGVPLEKFYLDIINAKTESIAVKECKNNQCNLEENVAGKKQRKMKTWFSNLINNKKQKDNSKAKKANVVEQQNVEENLNAQKESNTKKTESKAKNTSKTIKKESEMGEDK